MKENIMPSLPKQVGFEAIVKVVATTTPKEYKKKQKESQSPSNNSKS